jgi:hypothetical protein
VTDNLRDRIAAAINGIRIQRDGDSYEMAEAVIAALPELNTCGCVPIFPKADVADDNRSLRDRIYDSLQDYWPLEMDSIQRAQVRHCRDQIVAEVKDWLAIE